MGIGGLTLQWFHQLEEKHAIFHDAVIVDMGPQDLSSGAVGKYPKGTQGKDLYMQMGCKSYAAFDYSDIRAKYCDFNDPPAGEANADVVTNFGTSEHVFNQVGFMRFMHETTRLNGIMLHSLPSAGDRDHGLYNYQPCFFWDLARANNYEILHLEYLPHYRLQSVVGCYHGVNLMTNSQFNGLAIFAYPGPLRKAAARVFGERRILSMNVVAVASMIRNPKNGFGPLFELYRGGDYLHVALRKTSSRPFVTPTQGRFDPGR